MRSPWRQMLFAFGLVAFISAILAIVDVRSARRARRLATLLEVNRESEDYVEGYMDRVRGRPPRDRRQLRPVRQLKPRP